MSNIINTYPVFESSQVLTSSQLNQVVSYLDQQNRLSRAKLAGMGIVCGLELSYEDSDPGTQITISKGTAVTSGGFLISLGDCTASWYRSYELPEGVQYKPFGDPEQDIEFFELLKEIPEDNSGVKPLSEPAGFLDDKFVLLFLETFDNDLKPCLGNTCDELGIDRIFTVRKLLINREDLDLVLTRSANVGEQHPHKFELPDIAMPRTLFDPDADHCRDYAAFSEHYVQAFIDTSYKRLFGENSEAGALSETYAAYELLLGPHYGFDNPFETPAVKALKDTWTAYLKGTESPGPDYRGIQYFYDFLKDLILAYDEFRECAFNLVSECSPDMSLFPKHVMLGRSLASGETAEETRTYRHGFVQPPIYNRQKYLVRKSISLHKRLVLMVENFNLERINNPATGEELPLRVTPSSGKNAPLGKRSIPYYYNTKEESATVGEGSLESYWNFDVTRKKPSGTMPLILSYENQSEDQSDIASPFETPLRYDLDSYPFLRVEGHIGKEYEAVVELLDSLKSTFDLPFDTIALQLDPESGEYVPDYSCGFEDLQEDYVVGKSTFCGIVSDVKMLAQRVEKLADHHFEDKEEQAEFLAGIKKLIKVMIDLCESLPDCVDEFDFGEFRQGYKAFLQLVIYLNLLGDRLLDNMYTSRAYSLYQTFLRIHYAFRRRTYYLRQAQRDENVFSSYINRHSGIQHQAGVPKGGTFILVYENNEDREVIADFNLPYLCCGSETCVPLCDDEGSDFKMDIPPLARPDYAITPANTEVDIHVLLNDDAFLNSGLEIDITDEETGKGGKIQLLANESAIQYMPGEDFTGFDTFQYLLKSNETGAEDTGTVTVLVKKPEEEEEPISGCYPPALLQCWAKSDVRMLTDIYNKRHPESPISGSLEKVSKALHQSLRKTGGFTEEEIDATFLEATDRRRRLLRCIDESIPVENMKWETLGEHIRQYQKEKCGTVVEGDSTVVLGAKEVTKEELRKVLEARNQEMPRDATRSDLDEAIRKTAAGMSFTREEVMLFTKERILKILDNRHLDAPASLTKSELINILFGNNR